jgi:hypothetical protein
MPAVLLPNGIEASSENQQRSLQMLDSLGGASGLPGGGVPDTLSVDQWIATLSPFVSMKVENGVTLYDFDDATAGALGSTDFGVLAKMSCAAYNAQPEDRRRQASGLGLPQAAPQQFGAGGEQARYVAYWWGGQIWCNHPLCLELENVLYGVAGAAAIAALVAPLVPGAGHVLAVICAVLAAAGKAYGDAFKWADGKCQAAYVNFTWVSPATPWITQPC